MHEFTYSQRLTCFIHVKRNVKDKCNDLCIPSDGTQKIIDDIFGHTLADTFIEGLVDSENDIDFQEKVDSVVSSWREMPHSKFSRHGRIYQLVSFSQGANY